MSAEHATPPAVVIDLARRGPFRLGAIEVRPATREVIFDARREVVEPRVMQALIALADARGTVLSRDDLTRLCWDGRVVGEDAINRVMSRLRALARKTGAFRVETITKVGYRLVDGDEAETVPRPPAPTPVGRRGFTRGALGAGGAAVLFGGAAGAWWTIGPEAHKRREVRALIDRGYQALREHKPDDRAVARNSLRLAIERDPQNADAWGLLAIAYRKEWEQGPPTESAANARRALAAAARASELDPGNGHADAVRATLMPMYRNWLAAERALRPALERHPRHFFLLARATFLFADTGQVKAALPVSAQMLAAEPEVPSFVQARIVTLWDNGRLEEAEHTLDQALERWPRHRSPWFTKLYFLAFTGRTSDAVALIADREERPVGVPDWNWELVEGSMRALHTRAPSDIDASIAAYRQAIPKGSGFAENGLMFAATVGRLDEAFRIADAYYFGRGEGISDRRFADAGGDYHARRDRSCFFLFGQRTAAMRADPRFERLVAELGLDTYWRAAGVTPDYRRA